MTQMNFALTVDIGADLTKDEITELTSKLTSELSLKGLDLVSSLALKISSNHEVPIIRSTVAMKYEEDLETHFPEITTASAKI